MVVKEIEQLRKKVEADPNYKLTDKDWRTLAWYKIINAIYS